jgi:chromosomal replication initiation ATPase DnaA
MSMTAGIPPEALASAPRVWRRNGRGVGVRVVDPEWVNQFRTTGQAAEDKEAAAAFRAAVKEGIRKERAALKAEMDELRGLDQIRRAEIASLKAWLADAGIATDTRRMKPIAERICRATGYTLQQIRSERRTAELALVRMAICYWLYRLTTHSRPAIGKFISRDPTTVLHATRAYPQRRAVKGRYLRPIKCEERG